ncbi:putative DNA-directed DNA polymerase [Helianthus annuus]|uniref:DNA-directed DNA polymerase n=1 Tax=Helianthus annuus TaxID=4232 RepID=A0A9K3NA61_HELAN|nr:putative DNA-directed DNA polymerase [Helianthus annuus]KAJ0536352.1 putative DNA-directed DNA polymerase [Helianthus annuus]KAJ0544007.1 putative DNA-directed DNA polymerase [Helianthus annuus]KAJ0709060.1 putative DNA-directed DNA polymerase [Helianthus annuus]KAJ0712936.1 putative DNA-directed DNA polymerase [Helianthus annuus]
MGSIEDRPEIVFFDLETTDIPSRNQPYAILEYGSILVCPKKLTELHSYQTLVRPLDLSLISADSIRVNGITADHVVSCPTFAEIADKVYDILNGRVWAGHNIVKFDCVVLKEAYAQINRKPPVPKGIIDTLKLLTETFGRRTDNMKMATLAKYFGLGQQSHRSLDDVRMNFEVVKLCASVLFLESSQQDTENNWASLNAGPINSSKQKSTLEVTRPNISPFTSTETHTVPPNPVESVNAQPGPFHTVPMVEESSTTTLSNAFSNHNEFIDPDSVSLASITVNVAPFVNGPHRIQILHKDIPMRIRCAGMRIPYGLSANFVDHAGNPILSLVVNASSLNLCKILDACDNIARRFADFDGNSQWRPVLTRNTGFYNSPTIRLHIPTVGQDRTRWITDIYYKSSSSIPGTQQLVSSVAELKSLLFPGSLVDAYFSLDPYNYQKNAGIRLVANKLIIHTS